MGPLSNSEVIKVLNENFVNTCVLFRDLSELIEDPDDEKVGVFAKTIKDNYVGAVDIQVLNPEAEIIMHQPENKLRYSKYLALLEDTVNGKVSNTVVTNENSGKLTPKLDLNSHEQSMEVLNVFRGPGDGYQDYTPTEIDTTAFKQGGTLIIEIQVGEGEATGSFDLFDADVELPTEGYPDDAIASAWDIPPGDTGQIRHQFTHGQKFRLGATGNWFCEKGSTNAFLARIYVVPTETEETEESL